jgi:drug/metabolite transporter (DMT)-like permease
MLPFSFSYVTLDVGTGALILFGAVQLTMIGAGLVSGERPGAAEWTGFLLAAAGFVWFVLPGAGSPDPAGAVLMATAGIAWGVYSLKGKGSRAPLADTAFNFIAALPAVALLNLLLFVPPAAAVLPGAGTGVRIESEGLLLAVLSGALASGAGYAVWYGALRGLTSVQAAMVQLSVPLLAAAAGAAFMGETPGWRLVLAAVLVLGGIGLALRTHYRV